ncbi:IQ and ubiquitin-like domain-containing protein isoform X1 [Ischnura elegans]|uniref:IQ and ubiquitin-like domain-containing protein isoform X1 n=1 Tax=Ischnura elegans TaxID=197161 RepID=UPI001ED8B243|nr:IQ and ubiquitin-like domain-containing protein isoform X1 [Ischnura elegans]
MTSKRILDSDDLFTSAPRVTVKFKLPQDKVFTMPFAVETSTLAIRKQISSILKIPISDIILSKDSITVRDTETLASFSMEKCGTIIMNLHTSHTVDFNALARQLYGDLAVRDVISVAVDKGEGKEPVQLLVEIIKENLDKSFIGGYRHRLNRKEYHHVSSQTYFFSKSDVIRNERDTQTALSIASKLEGTDETKSTQTPVQGLYLIEPLNIELTPREYIPTKETKEKAMVLQKYWRRWLLRTKMNSVKFTGWGVLEDVGHGDSVAARENSLQADQLGNIDMFSQEAGSYEEMSKIFTGTLKNYFGKCHLKKEIDGLNCEDEERRCRRGLMKDQHSLNMIKKFCRPLTWIGEQGHSIKVETEHHQKLSNWYEIYRKYISDTFSMQDRKSLIMTMLEMLDKMGDWDNPRIHDLLTEQLDLLDIGVDDKHLTALQKITAKYLLAFFEDYVSKNLKQRSELSHSRSQVYVCKFCKRFKLQSSFRGKPTSSHGNVCKSCFWLENMSRRRVDYSLYQSILRSIQREEEKYNCLFSIAFVMQEEDIFYIVNTIWHGKSILSETKDVTLLRLCRFDNAIAWSPWNCFLITEKEMRAHMLVDNPLEVYGSWLFEQVRTKHLMGRLHYQHLWNKNAKPTHSKAWYNIKKSHNIQQIS